MKLVQVLKICVCAAFIASIVTGFIFMVRSSADDQGGKQMKAHEDAVRKDEVGKAQFPEEQQQKRRKDPEPGSSGPERVVPRPPPQHPKDIAPQRVAPPVAVQPPQDETEETTTKTTTITTPTTTAVTSETETTTLTTPAGSSTIEPRVLKELKSATAAAPPSIHIFYYPWYGNPEHNDGKYYHWNHRYLPNWNPGDHTAYPKGHSPPADIASVYYPSLGPYSSWDPKVIERHMKWMSSAGIDVVVCSWYPKGKADQEGTPWDSLMPALLNATDKAKMKMTFHLEPYDDRTVDNVRQDIAYLLDQYGSHPALYRRKKSEQDKQQLPLFYVYDSYRIASTDWATMLRPNATHTIRGTPLDSLIIGLAVDKNDTQTLVQAGFDGLYTYFAADGFSYGSTSANWPDLSAFCARNKMLFVPSVGPGYNDTRVRPWNSQNAHDRNKGQYYREHFKMAHTAKADIVSITSFNEWHEGTQIEPAIPYGNGTSSWQYAKYDGGPDQYLEITLEMVKQYFTPHNDNLPAKIARIV